MMCPNVNSQEWKTLVEAVGELHAYEVFAKMGDVPALDKNSAVYKTAKATYPKKAAALYYESLLDSDKSVLAELNREVSINEVQHFMDILKQKTGISYTLNTNLTGPGRFSVRGIEFNPEKLTADVAWHEYSHPIVATMYAQNRPLFDSFMKEIQSSPEGRSIIAHVRKLYPDLRSNTAMEQQEIVTTFLGAIAAKQQRYRSMENRQMSTFQKFLNYVKDWIRKFFSKAINVEDIDANTSMFDFAEMIFDGTKMRVVTSYNSEAVNLVRNTLIEYGAIDEQDNIINYNKFNQALEDINLQYPNIVEVTPEGKALFGIWDKRTNAPEYKTNTGSYKKGTANSDEYTNGEGKKLKAVGKGLRELSVNPEVRNMSDVQYKEHLIQLAVENEFKSEGIMNPTKDSKLASGMSYAQVAAEKKELLEHNQQVGRAYHFSLETLLQEAMYPDETDKLKQMQDEIVQKGYLKVYTKLRRAYKKENGGLNVVKLQEDLNIYEEDHVFSEIVISNEELGYAGTADLYVEHANGFVSIKDYKTGASLGNNESPYFFEGTDVRMTSLNMAKVQIVMYALLLKANNPDVKFRMLQVVHHDPTDGSTKTINVDLYEVLPIVKAKLIRDGKQDFIDRNPGLFKPEQYTGVDLETDIAEKFNEMSVEGIKDHLIAQMKKLLNVKSLSAAGTLNSNQVSRLKTLMQNYLDFTTHKRFNIEDMRDMDVIYRNMGDMLNVRNERLQAFSALYYQGYDAYHREMHKLTTDHERKLRAVLKERGVNIGSYLSSFLQKEDVMQYIGFMWIKDETGRWRFINEAKDGAEFKARLNTQAKREYYEFYTQTLSRLQRESMSKAELADMRRKVPGYGDEIFTPYVSKDNSDKARVQEVARRLKGLAKMEKDDKGKPIGPSRKEQAVKFFGFENDVDYQINKGQAGVPIAYTGYRANHTFDTDVMFSKVANNLVWKKHMDEVHGVGRILQRLMEKEQNTKTGDQAMKNNIAFLIGKLDQLVVGKKGHMSKAMSINIASADGTVKKLAMPSDKLFDAVRRWVTVAVMPLRPVLFVWNVLLENHFNVVRALRGSWAKRTGIDPHFIDYTVSDYLKANALMIRSVWDRRLAKKIDNISQKFHFQTDFNYNFDTTKKVFDRRVLREKYLYMTSYLGENYTYKVSTLAQMIRDDMFDKYNDEGEYIGGVRGKVRRGNRLVDIGDYTPEEIRRIREVAKKIHGSYADDQKAAVEAYGLGRLFLQFQKYKINYVSRQFIRSYNNDALGRYLETGKTEEGETIFEWENQVESGLFWTVGRWFAITTEGGLNLARGFNVAELKKRGMSDIQIQNLYSFIVSGALFAATVFSMGLLFDPDDDDKNQKNILYNRLMRLKNDFLGMYNPGAIVVDGKYPIVGLAFASDVAKTMAQLFALERYKTTSRRYGYKRGELKAVRTLTRRLLPLSSTYRESQTIQALLGMETTFEFRFDSIETDDKGITWSDAKFFLK